MKWQLTYESLLSKLEKGTPFAFTRWGDGEIEAVLGRTTPNCDGHSRLKDLKEALEKVLDENTSQNHIMGLQPLGAKKYLLFRMMYDEFEWCNADILHNASVAGKLELFFDALNHSGNIMLVSGNKHLFDGPIKVETYIPVAQKDCFYHTNVEDLAHRVHVHQPKIVLFAASMASNVWIAELWKLFPKVTFIDIGSVLDPYVGIVSRAYHRKIATRCGIPESEWIITGSQASKRL